MASSYDDDQAVNDDDEVIDDRGSSESSDDSECFDSGGVKMRITCKSEAPMESSLYNVLIELMATKSRRHNFPHDIVILLDASKYMAKDGRLERVKAVARSIIKRLNLRDCLSVIVYEGEVYRLRNLQSVGRVSRIKKTLLRNTGATIDLINELEAGGGSNLTAGLREAMKVLDDREITKGRRCAIVLLSDGDLHHADGNMTTQTYNVPIHTVHYGCQPRSQAFQKIASSSKGGTFTFVNGEDEETSDNFIQEISNFVAAQLGMSPIARNLRLTFHELGSKFEKVHSSMFPCSRDDYAGSVTISFGDLHYGEKLCASVDIRLDEVQESCDMDVLEITHGWISDVSGEEWEAPHIIVTVSRSPMVQQRQELSRDEAVQQTPNQAISSINLDDIDTKGIDDANPLQDSTTDLECDDNLDNLNLMTMLSELPREQRRSVTKDIVNKLRRVASTSNQALKAISMS